MGVLRGFAGFWWVLFFAFDEIRGGFVGGFRVVLVSFAAQGLLWFPASHAFV